MFVVGAFGKRSDRGGSDLIDGFMASVGGWKMVEMSGGKTWVEKGNCRAAFLPDLCSPRLCFPITLKPAALLHGATLTMLLCLLTDAEMTDPSDCGLKPVKLQGKLNLDYFS